MAFRNPFRKKPKPTYQYDKPIGPVQPGKSISTPTPGIQYDTPLGPPREGGSSGGGSNSPYFNQTQDSIAAQSNAAEQAAAQKAVELKAQQQAAAEQQKESIQERIIIKASGGVKVGDIRYVGNAIVPDTDGLTANQYRRKIRQQAIEEGIIDQKDYGKATLEINRQKEKVKEDKSSRVIETPPQSITAQLPGGELPQYNNFIVGDDIFGTRTDLGEANKVPSTPIYQEGTIFKVQTGSTPFEGYSVPTFEYQTMGETQSRPATKEEVTQLQDVITSEEYSKTVLAPPKSIISRTYQEQIGRYKAWASEPTVDIEWIKTQSAKGGKVGEFAGGVVVGTIGTKGDIVRTGIIYGATAGIGFGVAAVSKGITVGSGSLATAIWGAKSGATTSRVVGTTLQVAKVGAGAYFGGQYVYTTVTRISQADDSFEKGKITGRAVADVGASVYGFRTGTKLYDITEGYFKSKGTDYTNIATDVRVETGQRRFVQISQSEFNKLTQAQRGKLYQDIFGRETVDIQKALGVGKGGIHTTGNVGDYSELSRALHIAPRASTQFLDIPGSFSGKFNPSSYFKNLFNPPGSPRLVWFETPKGLKYVPGKEVSRGTYSWGKQLWSGMKAYIPGSKPEIEAIFDPSVTKGFSPVEFSPGYIVTHGVRVPFTGAYTPVGGSGGSTIPSGDISLYGSVSYNAPSLYTPASGIVAFYKPTSSSTTPTITSITPPYSSVSSFIPSYSIVSSRVSSSIGGSSRGYSPIKSSVAPSVSKAYSSIVGSSKSSKVSPSVSSLYSGLSGVGSSSGGGSSYMSSYKKQPTAFGFKIKPAKLAKSYGKYNVLGRRFGKFKTIGIAKTERGAFSLGKKWASKTLGATFKVPKAKWRKLPGYKTKTTKKGDILYIEPEKRRLKKRGKSKEIPEIQFYRSIKRGKKK